MSVSRQVTRFSRLSRRSFFLVGLLIAVALFFLNQRPNILPPSLTNYTHSLGLSFDKLSPQGLTNKLSTALDSICLWSRGVYGSSIEQNWWLINRWLVLAVVMGLLLPTVVLVLFFIIKGIRDHFEKNMVANKFLAEVVTSIKNRVSKIYWRSILTSWERASLIILVLGISLFSLQLLSANLWWWNKGVGFSSLFLFVLYAHWVYYEFLLSRKSTKQRLFDQIDSRLGLKQGLVTLMETKNFNASPRFYKLLLDEVFHKVKPANLTKILSHKTRQITKRSLAIPLVLILSLSGLASVAYSRLAFWLRGRNKVEYLFPLNREPESIEELLKREADGLRLLTTELQQIQADQQNIAYITDELDNLAEQFSYLVGEPPDIKKNYPVEGWYDYQLDLNVPQGQKGRNWAKKPNNPTRQRMPASIPQDWPKVSPSEERTVDIPLRANDKHYQAISAELSKVAQQLVALNQDGNTMDGKVDQQLALEGGLPKMNPSPISSVNSLVESGTESPQLDIESMELQNNSSEQDSQSMPQTLWQNIMDYLVSPSATSAAQVQKNQSQQKTSTSQANQQPNERQREDSRPVENPPTQAPVFQPIVNALDQISNQLSDITLHKAGEEENQELGGTRPATQSLTQEEVVNQIQLKPIKSKAKTEHKQRETTVGVMVLEHPHHLEIDPQTEQHPGGELASDQGFPIADHPPVNLKQRVKVSARRIEALGNRLLMVNRPEQISFNFQKGEAISSIWEKATLSIKQPRHIDNRLPQVTEWIKGVDDPRQIAAITSELAELTREFSAWGMDSGNKLSRLRPDLEELTESDSLGRQADEPLTTGGPDKADREAVIIRGKREQASQNNNDLERIRVEERPRHLPEHDIVTNVSLELNQVANRLENVDVASIKANMAGVNLRDFVVERERTLEILNDQLARAKDFSSINQATNKLADLSAQLGKLALDSLATAKLLANQQVIPESQKAKRDTANSELIDRINREGRELLELSQQIKQEREPRSRADTSSQILMLAKGLREVDFDQIILNDYNKLRLKSLLRNLSKQLRKIDRNTTDLADFNGNSYAVAALASRVGKLGVGEIDFTASAESSDGEDMLDLAQLARQLSNLSQQMQATAQAPTQYQANMPQPGENQELMEAIVDGAERLGQIKQRLELTGDQRDTERLGLDLVKLSQMLKGRLAGDSNDMVKAVSTKAIMSIGNQLKQVGQQLRSSPDDYQPISERLQQIAHQLEERNQELTAAQLASNQDIAQLASEVSQLAQGLGEMGAAALRQQERLLEQASNQVSPDEHQRLIGQTVQDLLDMSQDSAELSIEETFPEYANRSGRIIDELKGSNSSTQFDSLGRELAQLSQGLRQIGHDPEEAAVANRQPRIASELAELSQGLTPANITGNRANPNRRRLNTEQNGTPTELIAADSRRRRELALQTVEQTIERLKLQYRETENRYNPDLSLKGLNLATKGIAEANKGIMGKLKDSPYTLANFTADRVAKRIDITPEKEKASNAYSMEHNLTERDVFSRIIERLEDKRERIRSFGTLKWSEATTSRRTGSFSQPQNPEHENRMLTMIQQELAQSTEGQEQENAFTERPVSYHDTEVFSYYNQEVLMTAKDIYKVDRAKLSKLPLEKKRSNLKIQSNLELHPKQAMDKALQDQLIPLRYKKIIRKLYLH